jgi:DNA polymerase-3 subunit delta'
MEWHIHGHDWAVNLLRAHAAGDRLRHAYLFVGPQGVGRRTLALRFAQALNCSQPPEAGEFCDECRDCRQIWSMTYPDLSPLEPEEGHKDILIDQVRALQHTLALASYSASYRVALLPDFQRATTQAANALLKTLEEPPDRVILLLTADALESLLPTIVSRCEVVRLRPSSLESTQAFLESEKGLTPEKAKLVAHLSNGRIGAAIRMAEDPTELDRRGEHLDTFLKLLSANRVERFKLASSLSRPYDQARQKVGEVLPIWLSFWRDVFVRASGAGLPLVNIDQGVQVDTAAAQLNAESARALVIAHEKAFQQMDAYANVQLLVENLMLQWPILSVPLEIERIKKDVKL